MLRTFTCIMCPQGCEITAEGANPPYSLTGNKCKMGAAYVEQELTAPMRNIATSILVDGGELPLASVRLTEPIPKKMIFQAMEEIKKIRLKAPVKAGTVVVYSLLGQETDVIVTKDIPKA